jgi:hypothetical protein
MLLAGLVVACSGPAGAGPSAASATPPVEAGSATQVSDANQVKVAATWRGPERGPIFEMALDTHVVDLDGYDLTRLAVLRTDQGLEVAPSGWDAPKGGHHRSGTLSFPPVIGDRPVISPGTGAIELIVRDVAGVPERTFRWTL